MSVDVELYKNSSMIRLFASLEILKFNIMSS